jgi:tetratricopeptide (TPR) repeat protein
MEWYFWLIQTKAHDKAIDYCTRALAIEDGLIDALIHRGEAYLATEEYEKAKADFGKGHEADRQNERVPRN